jgi:hypothetical protein
MNKRNKKEWNGKKYADIEGVGGREEEKEEEREFNEMKYKIV